MKLKIPQPQSAKALLACILTLTVPSWRRISPYLRILLNPRPRRPLLLGYRGT